MKNKFTEMFVLQDTLNINTNGVEWNKGVTEQGRTINWYRCIYMEAVEAIDSLNWKHWKDINKADDIDNLKIELVDIWHFIMSQAIVDKGIKEAINDSYKLYMMASNTTYQNKLNLVDILEKIVLTSASKELPIELFFRAVNEVKGFTMKDVCSLYIGKNCLNQFRQDNGYKDGSYTKVWCEKEDNAYMQEIMNNNPDTTYDELYSSLSLIYSELPPLKEVEAS